MKTTTLMFFLAATFVMLSLGSCKKDHRPNPHLTLYDSLGGTMMVKDPTAAKGALIEKGRLGIRSLIDSAIFVIAADTKINHYFNVLLAEVTSGDLSGFQELSKNLTDFFCVATGAKDFTYTGLNMHVAHNPGTDTTTQNPRISEKVNSADFDEFIVDVAIAAHKINLPDYLTARVAAVAESVKGAVVQR